MAKKGILLVEEVGFSAKPMKKTGGKVNGKKEDNKKESTKKN